MVRFCSCHCSITVCSSVNTFMIDGFAMYYYRVEAACLRSGFLLRDRLGASALLGSSVCFRSGFLLRDRLGASALLGSPVCFRSGFLLRDRLGASALLGSSVC